MGHLQSNEEIRELRARLEEAEETLRAIREGEVDAIVVSGSKGEQVFSLMGTEHLYRLIVETMREAALVFSLDGTVLYCNAQFGQFIGRPLEGILGHPLARFVAAGSRAELEELFAAVPRGPVKRRLVFHEEGGGELPAYISASLLDQSEGPRICMVASDLTELENSTELIRQLRRQQEALRESELRYRTVADNTHDFEFWIGPDGRYLYASPSCEKIYGREAAQFLENPALRSETVFPEDRELFERHLVDEVGRIPGSAEFRIARPDGSVLWILHTCQPVYNERGEYIGLRGNNRDVTARKQTEMELSSSREKYRALVESTEDFIWEMDASGRYTYCSPQMEKQWGLKPEEMLGRTPFSMMPAERRDTAEREFAELANSPRPFSGLETTSRDSRGREIHLEVSGSPFYDESGRLLGFRGITRDVTERKRAEEEIRERGERLQQALLVSRSFSFEWEPATDRVTRSKDCEPILGLTGEDAISDTSANFFQRIHPKDRERFVGMLGELSPGYDSYRTIYRLVRPDGGVIVLEESGRGFFDAAGRLQRLAGISTDVTQREEAREALHQLNESLDRRVAERTAEARHLADQLRTLAAELAQAEQRERKNLATLLHDHIQQLLVAAKMQLGLIRGADRPALESTVRGVEAILKEAIDATRSLAVELSPPILYQGGLAPALGWLAQRMEEKDLFKVRVVADSDAEPGSEATRLMLFESVRELLLNAVKYSGVREASVTMSRTGDGWTRIVVEDKGAGFDPAALKSAKGSGLGLFSIQQRMAYLGGNAAIESAPGQGARAVLSAPPTSQRKAELINEASRRGHGAPTAPRDRKGRRISVLLADDHKIVREGLVSLLRFEPDMEVAGEARDGREAVEMARRLNPDVVIIDVSMPEMDGVEATRIITNEMPHVRVIGLSMSIEKGVSAAMHKAGASGFLSKEVPSEELIAAIRACAAAQGGRFSASQEI